MSANRKIIEHKGTKYYKEEGRWYRLVQIKEDSVPSDIKNKSKKISFPQETQLDIFKCLNFCQLLSFQQSSFYFKNIIDKYGKELAKKKFARLKFRPVYDEKWEKNKIVKVQVEHEFVEIEPHLYDFELSEQLKEKWEHGIDESIPMFFTFDDYEDIDIVVCELEQNYNEFYYLQLPKFPKNMEEMAIARFVFQLLFNCAFEYFEIYQIIINPQLIELLFDETTNMPLQIHSQRTEIFYEEDDCLNFAWNHLISNQLAIDLCFRDKESMGVLLFKILAEGGNKFLNIIYDSCPDVELYNSIVEYIETSQDISKVVKEIKFEYLIKFSIERAAKNKNKLKIEEDGKTTKFQLFNKHNPKIKFSVTIKILEEKYEEIEEEDEGSLENFDYLGIEDDFGIAVDVVIIRI